MPQLFDDIEGQVDLRHIDKSINFKIAIFGAKALIFFVFDDGTALLIESHIEEAIF